MRVFEERQRFNQWWLQILNLSLLGILVYSCLKWFYFKEPVGNVGEADLESQLVVLILLPAVIGLIYVFKLSTLIDERGVMYGFFPFHLKQKLIPWSEIKQCSVRQYRPLSEYGGWGYRMGPKGKAFTVKGNKGIQVVLKNNQKILIGTQKHNEAQAVIDKYFKHERI
ncbi:MAG: hypothetical protein HKP38_03450 [Croceitalea sp.]|nr:hypothetical protein [Croceitalea sp.]